MSQTNSLLTDGRNACFNLSDSSFSTIRSKRVRRYNLLPVEKLSFPGRSTYQSNYIKHMPLISIDTDEDEDGEKLAI